MTKFNRGGDTVTFEEWLAGIIDRKCINPSKLSKEIGISYKVVYNSLFNKKNAQRIALERINSHMQTYWGESDGF